MANEFIIKNGYFSQGSSNVTGSLIVSASGATNDLRVGTNSLIISGSQIAIGKPISNYNNATVDMNRTLIVSGTGIYTNAQVIAGNPLNPGSGYNPAVAGYGSGFGGYFYSISSAGPIGVYGYASDDGGEGNTGDAIGGKFEVGIAAYNRYAVQLIDNTEGIGKVLVSQTSDGKANWAQTVNSASRAISASYSETASYVNPLRQTVLVTGSLNISSGSLNITSGSQTFSTSNVSASNTFNLNSNVNLGLIAGTSAGISFVVNNTSPAMYITSASQVLIGNPRVEPTSGSATLHVTNVGTINSFLVEDSTNPDSSPFVIDASGSVGIGIASTDPLFSSNTKLQVYTSGSLQRAIRIRETSTSASFNFWAITSSDGTRILRLDQDTTGTNVMTWAQTGNVGIGTTTPNARLDVSGSAIVTGSLSITSGSQTIRFISGSNTSGYTVSVGINDDGVNIANNSIIRGFNFSNINGRIVTMASILYNSAFSNYVGIGIPSSSSLDSSNPEQLLVSGSTINNIVGKTNINNYTQLNIVNTNSGTSASADVVATNNTGNESGNFIDMGINGSGYTGGIVGVANEAYLYNTGSQLWIGNATPGSSGNVNIFAGNLGTSTAIFISSSQRVSINKITPNATFDVNGNAIITGSLSVTSVSNSSGSFVTIDANNTLNSRTAAQTRVDINYYGLTYAMQNGYY